MLVEPAGAGTHDIAGVGSPAIPCRDAAIRVGNADDGVVVRRRGARLEGFEDGPAASPGPARMPLLASTRISLMPAGTLNGIAGLSASASFMKSLAIGAAI